MFSGTGSQTDIQIAVKKKPGPCIRGSRGCKTSFNVMPYGQIEFEDSNIK